MFWTGIAVGILVLASAFGIFTLFVLRRLILSSPEQVLRELQRLLDYGEDSESLVFEDHYDKFAQFRKYVNSSEDWGIDFVFPVVAAYEGKQEQVFGIAKKYGVKCQSVETEYGWPFVFMQVSEKGNVNEDLSKACLRLAQLNFEKKVGVGGGSTFDQGRRRKVFGNTKSKNPGKNRYSVVNPMEI